MDQVGCAKTFQPLILPPPSWSPGGDKLVGRQIGPALLNALGSVFGPNLRYDCPCGRLHFARGLHRTSVIRQLGLACLRP